MHCRILSVALALMCSGLPVTTGDPSWKGKEVILTRAGVKLEVPPGEKIAPRTSGIARDVTFQVLEDKDGRILIESPPARLDCKSDAVLPISVVAFSASGWRAIRGQSSPSARGVVYVEGRTRQSPSDLGPSWTPGDAGILSSLTPTVGSNTTRPLKTSTGDWNDRVRLGYVRGWIYYRLKDYDRLTK
jgi:hypothetical protein